MAQKNKRVITFHYTLTDQSGQTLDSSSGQDPLSFIEGEGHIIPGLETTLITLKTGDKRRVDVAAAQAYGERDDERIVSVPKEQFPSETVAVGDLFQAAGDPDFPPLTVVEVTETHVVLDANHPLAGQNLTFDVEIVEMRDASAEELSHGHAHGAGGHHH